MKNSSIGVLGFGKTGQAMLEYLLVHEPQAPLLLFNDDAITDRERRDAFERRGVRFLIGADAFAELGACRLVITSPGFDGTTPRFSSLRARGVEIVSEIEYASGRIRAGIIAVSGSNGKSTTVSLIHHLLVRAGRTSILAGNIGVPFIAQTGEVGADSTVVLELSSFQLEEIVHFRADVAVLLNITPDHLDRYPSMAAYAAAKFNLFKNQRREDRMVLNADDPWLQDEKRLGPAKPLWFSSRHARGDGAVLENRDIVLSLGAGREKISLQRNPLRGVHNLENIMAAALACRAVGLTAREIEAGLESFRGLPHRMEAAGKVGRVEFINDSKATNVDAALKSIASIDDHLVVILGGKDKGSDFSGLEKPLREKAQRVLLLGKAAPLIAAQLRGLAEKMVTVRDLAEAVGSGYELLRRSGGVVLLAPACASFDMFDNFEHRGEVFKQEVRRLQDREKENG
ncbi:MAG: UDP-N-acetylmuramoyl-L-alanine--D-glutamate ligase [Candidatus Aminicenantes bacterium]|nr:UDP-N-acetylmuramoyl-L-alanine--D-glutamate ligase [Candidatus Aminicenantes bacterium]